MASILPEEEQIIQDFQQQVQQGLCFKRPDYRIKKELGRGSFGIAYEIENEAGDILCLKVLATPGVEKPGVLRAVEALGVAGILAREKYPQMLHHPNIVDVIESISILVADIEIPCVVQKKIDGSSLEELLKRNGILQRKDFALFAQGIAAGVGYIHEKGFAHRDLKLDNIMVDSYSGASRICDFSIAERIDEQGIILNPVPAEPSARYSAPEVRKNLQGINARRADVFSLGVIFYELLTGKNPLQEGTIIETALPRRYRAIIRSCLHEEPERRYKDGNAVFQALRHAEWHYAERAGVTVAAFLFAGGVLALPVGVNMVMEKASVYYTNKCINSLGKENPKKTEIFCRKAIGLDKSNSIAYLYLGDSLIQQGKDAEWAYRRAMDITGDARSIHPEIPPQIKERALRLQKEGKTEEAQALDAVYAKLVPPKQDASIKPPSPLYLEMEKSMEWERQGFEYMRQKSSK